MSEHLKSRLTAVRGLLDSWEVDGLLIGSSSNRRWLTGFTGSAGWLIVSQSEAVLATDFRYWEQAVAQAPYFTLHRLPREARALESFVARHAKPAMGLESKHLTLHEYRRLRRIEEPTIAWKGLSDTIEALRECKGPEEISLIANAAGITDKAMAAVNDQAQPGMSERELAWLLEKMMRESGADRMAFPVNVASGPNAANPHHTPGDRRLQVGDPIIIDMGASCSGYCSDLTRTFHLGDAPDESFWRIYELVETAQHAALSRMRAGLSGKAIDAFARDRISEAGYVDQFGHSLGHGVGLDIHEGPRLAATNEVGLPAGSVVTIEPGVYVPGWGGVRIEDLILVDDTGVTPLSRCPKRPIIQVDH